MGWHHACPCAMEPAQHTRWEQLGVEWRGEDAGAGQVCAHCTLLTAHCKKKSDVPVGELSYARGRRLMNSCGGSPAPCPALRMGARRDLIGPGLGLFA
jgi:hypothetical protein